MTRKITLLALILSISNAFSQDLNFTNKADKPIARSGSASSKDSQDDNIYIANGFSATDQGTTEIEKYNLYENTWSLFQTSIPTIAKKYGNMEILSNIMYIFNGTTDAGTYNNKLEVIELSTGNLTVNSTLNPNPVSGGGSSVWGDYLVSFGGCANRFNGIYSNKLYKIAPWGDWTELAQMPVGLEAKGEVIYGNGDNSKLYVFGGYRETSKTAENFQAIATGSDLVLANWTNVAEAGTKHYQGKYFGTNKYAEITAFSADNQEASNISWLISNPVTATGANPVFLSFDSNDGYNNGATLQAYLITNWTGDITTSTKTLLNAYIAGGSVSGYGIFRNSGEIALSGDLSNFRIGFKYVGGYSPASHTTTYQVDNVRIYETAVSNNIYIYDFTGNSWTTSNTVLPQSLSAYAIAKGDASGTKIFITGDYSNQTFTGVYNTENDTFASLSQSNMIGRRHHSSEIWNDNLYIFGGNATPSISSVISSSQSADLSALSTPAFASGSGLKIYPNPVSDVLYFEDGLKNVSLFTIDGKETGIKPVNNSVNVSKLSSGIYFLKGEDRNGKTFSTKVIKK